MRSAMRPLPSTSCQVPHRPSARGHSTLRSKGQRSCEGIRGHLWQCLAAQSGRRIPLLARVSKAPRAPRRAPRLPAHPLARSPTQPAPAPGAFRAGAHHGQGGQERRRAQRPASGRAQGRGAHAAHAGGHQQAGDNQHRHDRYGAHGGAWGGKRRAPPRARGHQQRPSKVRRGCLCLERRAALQPPCGGDAPRARRKGRVRALGSGRAGRRHGLEACALPLGAALCSPRRGLLRGRAQPPRRRSTQGGRRGASGAKVGTHRERETARGGAPQALAATGAICGHRGSAATASGGRR